jgi:predicted nucleic acid-binding protein
MSTLPAGSLLFDTGIYIRFIRGEKYEWLGEDSRIFQRTILTAVVAAELYAGTRSSRDKRALDGLCSGHRDLGHFSSPSADTWIRAGVLMRRAHALFGELSFADHFRDALIALEAAHARATLVTENVADFVRWKSLAASAGITLKLFNAA